MSARRRIVCLSLGALAPAAALLVPAVAVAGPVAGSTVVAKRQVRPGVVLTQLRLRMVGGGPSQALYRVAWRLGDRHVDLHAEPRGSYDAATRTIANNPISGWASWGAPNGLVAAMTADFSTPVSPGNYRRSHVSGLLVHARSVLSFGWGGPGVGYEPDGRFVIGQPRAVPALLPLPGASARIGAWNPGSAALTAIHGDQVAVYTKRGTHVAVPAGYVGARLGGNQLNGLLRGSQATKVGGHRETVVGFRFLVAGATQRRVRIPVLSAAVCPDGPCPAGSHPLVPAGGAVLVAHASTRVGHALATLAAASTPSVPAILDDGGWQHVHDVTGGKPLLVSHGRPVSSRPAMVDQWQWSCGGGCWRTALVRSRDGHGWLVVAGQPGGFGAGMTMRRFAAVLAQLGARQAIGFDANDSAELYLPGRTPITGYGYERRLPTLTALTYR